MNELELSVLLTERSACLLSNKTKQVVDDVVELPQMPEEEPQKR